ncbi:Aste57867_23444 [Aphanomyces stellatus]|uniref:Aste57867_23444 protein n=1 Tax=Aphanomyces stellatus TaxID=120398 RepID=A0A485LPK9_9STRA|nr:hypothetical protein As57867_023373 [Aphanomyces stellatus]VFU00090.1 Aste57867_23444 [Aphanomyces stellatus]
MTSPAHSTSGTSLPTTQLDVTTCHQHLDKTVIATLPTELDPLVANGPMTKSLAYRRDIDGLRGVAILLVLLEHTDLVHGGFVGVDVFFALSGYLITSILLQEVDACGTISLADFYGRRVRRLFPSLLVLLVVVLVVGISVLSTSSLIPLLRSIFLASVFGANVPLMTGHDLVDSATATTLIHLWSLSVEEQFYLVWPFVVSFVARLTPRRACFALTVLTLLSFGLNIGLTFHYAPDTPRFNTIAYSHTFGRFWQLSSGGLLALLELQRDIHVSPNAALTISLVGSTLLALGVATTQVNYFPGLYALLPTTGALLLLHAGMTSPWNAQVLARPPLVYLGRISYTLYLLHYPMLQVTALVYPTRPWFVHPVGVIALSVLLATASLHVMENPLRQTKPAWAVPLLVTVLALLAIGTSLASIFLCHSIRCYEQLQLGGDTISKLSNDLICP